MSHILLTQATELSDLLAINISCLRHLAKAPFAKYRHQHDCGATKLLLSFLSPRAGVLPVHVARE